MTRELPSQEFIEQKITKQITVAAGAIGTASIDIPREKTVFLKGYGYTWFTLNTYKLNTGNTGFPKRTDQEGSPAIPALFGTPFKCRSGGKLQLTIKNADSSDHTYDVVFYVVSNELLDEISTGGDLNLSIGGVAGIASQVAIVDSTGTTSADVTADGLQVYITKELPALPAGSNNIGSVNAISASPTTLRAGTIATTSDTAIAIAASATIKKVTVQSDVNNTVELKIGNSTAQEVVLGIGQSIDLEVDDLAKIFIKRTASTNVTINYVGA